MSARDSRASACRSATQVAPCRAKTATCIVHCAAPPQAHGSALSRLLLGLEDLPWIVRIARRSLLSPIRSMLLYRPRLALVTE